MKLNEDFTNLYKRWSNGKKRREDGTEVETPLGKVLLKNPSCDYMALIKKILNDGEDYPGMVINSIQIYSSDEIKNIRSGLDYVKLKDNGGHGADLVFEFDAYEEEDDYGIMDGICEEDYKSICALISDYLNKNVDLQKPKDVGEDYVLYLGDASDVDEFFYDDFKSEFENEFSPNGDLKFWSYQYDNSIGIELDYDNLMAYDKMVEFTENQIEYHRNYGE